MRFMPAGAQLRSIYNTDSQYIFFINPTELTITSRR